MNRILIVEDDRDIAGNLLLLLKKGRVYGCCGGNQGGKP